MSLNITSTLIPDYEDDGVSVGETDLPVVVGDAEKCRRDFVYGGKDYGECAALYNVTVATVKKWCRDGGWLDELKLIRSGVADEVSKAMEDFARARELPLVHGYYELQRLALERLHNIVKDESSTVHTVGVALDVAEKGLNLGERVMFRADPKRGRDLLGAGVFSGGSGKVEGGGVQVNVLAGALSSAKRMREEVISDVDVESVGP